MFTWKNSKMLSAACSLALVTGLIGCSNESKPSPSSGESQAPSASPSVSAAATAPPVQLKWYYIAYEMQPDTQAVEEAVNAYLKPKINTTVKLMPTLEAGYKNKINTMLAANEEFDLLWTANWGTGGDTYEPNSNKGAYVELDALLEKTPKLKQLMPAFIWDSTRVNGKIYGVPNYQIAAKADGFAIQKQFIDKYKFDVSKIKAPADIEPFLKLIKENEPDVVPIMTTSNMFDFGRHYGFNPHGFRNNDPEYKVVDNVQQPEYKKFLEMTRRWYQAGYIYKDAATAKSEQFDSLLKSGKVAVEWNTTMKPGGEVDDKKRFGGNEVVYVRLSEPEFTGVQATMTAISKTSKNPERAIQFLELINTDATLFNLLTFGIEGKHYTKVGDNTIKINQAGGYKADLGWVMGNSLIGYLKEGQPADTWVRTKELNETAKSPDTGSWRYSIEEVKTERANLTAVEQEYAKALNTGTVDHEDYLPKYIEARKKAGVDKVIAYNQKQLNEWLKANKK